MARADETQRDLLFGLLALQNGLIDQDQLRSRPDFQLMMMDLAFPNDPFLR